MIYQWELSTGHQISVDNEGAQTIVTIVQSSPGQQQRTSNSFTTGIWVLPPEMIVTPTGAILKITTSLGVSTLHVQGNSVLMHSHQSDGSQSSSSSATSTASFERMQPMTMQSMKPMQPMTMQMGDMNLTMGKTVINQQSFCTQCGNSVKPIDRFCAGCGHKLVG